MAYDKSGTELVLAAETSRLSTLNTPMAAEGEAPPSNLPLSHYLWIVKRHRWRILAFVALSVVATLIVSLRIRPIYESTATVDIDRQTPQGLIGQDAVRASSLNDSDQFLATQMRLVQSDSVLRPVAQKYGLQAHERQYFSTASAAPAPRPDAPVILKQLRVTRPSNTYLLLISYRSPDPQLAANVANDVAQSYLEHTYNIRFRSSASQTQFMEKQLEELRAKMERSSAALAQFERELNVINPEEKTNITSARLLQLNTEYTNAQADRVRKEAAYQSIRSGALEAAQVSSQGEELRKLAERLREAREHFSEIQAQYGAKHPEYRKAAGQLAEVERSLDALRRNIIQRVQFEYQEAGSREAMLARAVQETKAEFDRLNARSFEYQALKREAEGDKQLYEELVRKIREAGINASFQNSSVRIADQARPAERPVFPNVKLNVLLALLVSTLAAVGAAVVNDTLDNTVRDPEQITRTLKTEVLGSLPEVKNWQGRPRALATPAEGTTALVPARPAEYALSGYEEAMRTLRNSILLTDFDRRLRSLLVTSAAPGEGKSTVAAHLASAHAGQHHRTLLIDGDLRRPTVHKRFGLSSSQGLTNVLVNELGWREALVKPEGLPDLDILPAGPPSRRAADLIGRGLTELLDEASLEYDLVVLDAPPLLGFAEPLQMATAVDGVVVVTRAGQTDRRAVASVLSTLTRLRANVMGVVLNQVHKDMSDSYYYYGHYHKYYKDALPDETRHHRRGQSRKAEESAPTEV